MTITFYKTYEEMFEDMHRQRRIADLQVSPAQAEILPGQYFINHHRDLDLFVFGEILDYKTLGVNDSEQEYINEIYEQPHMKYYRPTKAYSIACPMGEIGDIHLSTISAIIDKELFKWYQNNGWIKPIEDEN